MYDFIIYFEKELSEKIIDILELFNQYEFNKMIIYNKDKLLHNEFQIENDFDYKVHLTSMYNFILNNYEYYLANKSKDEFIEIIKKDFYLYWSKIKFKES